MSLIASGPRGEYASVIWPPAFDLSQRIITILTGNEIDALLSAPHARRWEGRRDRS